MKQQKPNTQLDGMNVKKPSPPGRYAIPNHLYIRIKEGSAFDKSNPGFTNWILQYYAPHHTYIGACFQIEISVSLVHQYPMWFESIDRT